MLLSGFNKSVKINVTSGEALFSWGGGGRGITIGILRYFKRDFSQIPKTPKFSLGNVRDTQCETQSRFVTCLREGRL